MPRLTTLTTPLGSDAYGDEILVFRQLAGSDGLSTLSDYTLTAHSTRADIAPAALLGKAVTITLLDQHAQPRYLHALVQQFHWRGRDDRFHLYEIKLVPWLWLGHCNQDCRIFQQQTVVQIIDEVLAGYPYPIHKRLFDTYPPLNYCVQYNETDFAFVSRLMEAAGIYYFFAHTADAHTLVLCDYASAHGQLPGHAAIPFCAPDRIGLAREETIHEWRPQQGLKSGRHVTDDYDFTQPHARLQQRRQDPKQHAHDDYEMYQWPGDYTDPGQGEQIARVRLEQHQHQHHTIEANSNVRALALGAPGALFALKEHPQPALNREVLVVATTTFVQENPSATGDGEHSEWRIALTVAPSEHPYRPARITPLPKTNGPQTATVTGPAGHEVWTNAYGQVKVQFHWDRTGQKDEHSSCWIRVASSWAGGHWGEVMVPRIGQEVVVDFLNGNPDTPLITGRVTNARQMPSAFSHTGSLPGNQALAGIKSKEHQGSRYNQLLFDDTSGQIRTQLASEHGQTELNLGYLTQPRNAGSAAPRGEGFELRTDHWGALRAATGVLLSSDPRPGGSGHALSREELVTGLEQALQLAKSLGDYASQHQGNASDPAPQQHLAQAVRDWGHGANADRGNNGGTPLFAVSAPAGIALATPHNTTIASGRHIDLVADQHQQWTAGQQMTLHAGQGISQFAHHGGIKSIAQQGKHLIQAQQDDIQYTADQSVDITASRNHVLMAAGKHVTLTSGGGYIKIADGNIELHCPGNVTVNGADYSMPGPDSMDYSFPQMPKTVLKNPKDYPFSL